MRFWPLCSSARRAIGDHGRVEGGAGGFLASDHRGGGDAALPDWYGALVTFTREGGLVATITDGAISTGHGAWSKVGSHEFAITIELRQFASGAFVGTLKATATITVNNAATQFTSDEYRFELFDSDGNSTGFSGIGQATGIRISP